MYQSNYHCTRHPQVHKCTRRKVDGSVNFLIQLKRLCAPFPRRRRLLSTRSTEGTFHQPGLNLVQILSITTYYPQSSFSCSSFVFVPSTELRMIVHTLAPARGRNNKARVWGFLFVILLSFGAIMSTSAFVPPSMAVLRANTKPWLRSCSGRRSSVRVQLQAGNGDRMEESTAFDLYERPKSILTGLRVAFVGLSAILTVQALASITSMFLREIVSITGVTGSVFLALLWASLAFVAFTAQPMVPCSDSAALLNSPTARFSRTSEGWLLCEPADPQVEPNNSTLFLLYCGVKLDPTHYAGQACELAKQGVSTLILQSPLNLVFFPPVPPLRVVESMTPRFTRFVLGGHSLGALYCCRFLQDSAVREAVAAVVILGNWVRAAAPCDLSGLRKSDAEMPVALINGDLDIFVLEYVRSEFGGDMASFEHSCRSLLPASAELMWVEGGNHFGFCDVTYGRLEGYPFRDGELQVGREEQQQQTAAAIAKLCGA